MFHLVPKYCLLAKKNWLFNDIKGKYQEVPKWDWPIWNNPKMF